LSMSKLGMFGRTSSPLLKEGVSQDDPDINPLQKP
jgi:hypothetical protein